MRVLHILRAILREIFDEAAYERFCARERLTPDHNSYSLFVRDREQAEQQKVRCC